MATTITLVCGAFDLSQARMRIVSRVAARVSSATTTATWASCTRCGCWISMWRGSRARQFEGVAHSSWSWKKAVPSVMSGWLIGASAESTQSLVRAYYRALDEQSVDTARVLDRIGQPATGLNAQRQRAGTEMDVEVEQGSRGAAPSRQEAKPATLQSVEAPTPPRTPITAAITCGLSAWASPRGPDRII